MSCSSNFLFLLFLNSSSKLLLGPAPASAGNAESPRCLDPNPEGEEDAGEGDIFFPSTALRCCMRGDGPVDEEL